MKPTENDILNALKTTVSASDLNDKIPSLSEERLNQFFDSISKQLMGTNEAEVFIDGASDSDDNGGVGVVLKSNGKELGNISRSVGKKTNNEAEYLAMIAGLELALNNNLPARARRNPWSCARCSSRCSAWPRPSFATPETLCGTTATRSRFGERPRSSSKSS